MLEDDLALDLGGGPSWKHLLEDFPQEKIRCIEFNVEMLDQVPEGVMVYRDFDRHGLPFHDNSVVYVRAYDILEHMRDLQFVVNEVWRVLKHGGLFKIKCPSANSLGAWGNPDHVRVLNTYTIQHLAEPIPNSNIFSVFDILENNDNGDALHALLRAVKEGVDLDMRGSPAGSIGMRV